jgi:AraC family transcriptional regulator of adaptative response/methylated-DNA-[protein]-cysteine methyltransferase
VVSADYERIRRAIEFIRANASEQPSLAEVASSVGLSPSHFQRLFRRWAGVSPKRFLQHLNATAAKRLLRDSRSVLDTALEVGLSGPSRLHDLIVSSEAVTPGQYARRGEGLTLRYGLHDSLFGNCLLATTERGVCALRFVEPGQEGRTLDELREEWPRAKFTRDQPVTAAVARTIFAERRSTQILLYLEGTNFQLKVWEALIRIPDRSVTSYDDLARRIGRPQAARAVANAVGANPIGYLIPCHRVLRSSGAWGGYRWGLARKELMLMREFVRADSQPGSQPRRTDRVREVR